MATLNPSSGPVGAESVAPSPDSRMSRFNAWRKRVMPDSVFMTFVALIIGIICGALAWVFKKAVAGISGFFISRISDWGANWWLILLPIGGILLTGIFTRYIIHTNLTHGVGQLINALRRHSYRLKHNICFSPVVGGSITLGLGGSAGAEGPIAYAGAAIGSNVGQFLGLPPKMLKILIGCGTSAGIAGIFSAPIGGLMFALELVRIELSVPAILMATASCLASFLTIFTLHGFHYDLQFSPPEGYTPDMILMVVVLGIFCGIFSIYYSYVNSRLDVMYRKIRNPWARNITGGLLLGLALFLFPTLYSVGYPVLGSLINGDSEAILTGSVFSRFFTAKEALLLTAGGILLVKSTAVASTNSSGGVGGDFAPTLFSGGIAGFLFATLCNIIFGTQLPPGVFGYFGMAASMSGIIQAPLMAIFITLEMTGTYRFALPVSVAALTSYCIVALAGYLTGHMESLVHHHHWFYKK